MLIMFDNGKRYNIQGGPEETEAMNSWPYQIAKCQILTNFQKKITGRFLDKFAVK